MTPEQMKALADQAAKAATDAVAAQLAEKEKALAEKAASDAKAALADKEKELADKEKELAEKEKELINQAKQTPPSFLTGQKTPGVTVGKHMSEGKGINFARSIQAKAVAQMTGRSQIDVLKSWGDEVVVKALSQSDFAGMGSTVHPEFAGEFIELLRAQAVVRKAGARSIPMGASLTFDRQTGAGSAGYGGSVDVIAPSNGPTTDQLVLSEKKLTALTPVPNDLLRSSSIKAAEFIRDDLLLVMALKEDEKFLFGSGVQYEPLGLLGALDAGGKVIGDGQIDPSQVYNETVNSAGAPTLQEMKAEINKAKKKLKKANAPMRRLVWFITPDTEAAILNQVGPGAEGYNSLEREMVERGTIGGYPYFVSNQIPTNLDTGNARTRFALIDMSEVLIGDSLAVEVEVFPNGHYSSGGAVVSGISTDRTVIRAISKHDIGMRHRKSGVVIKNSSWGL